MLRHKTRSKNTIHDAHIQVGCTFANVVRLFRASLTPFQQLTDGIFSRRVGVVLRMLQPYDVINWRNFNVPHAFSLSLLRDATTIRELTFRGECNPELNNVYRMLVICIALNEIAVKGSSKINHGIL